VIWVSMYLRDEDPLPPQQGPWLLHSGSRHCLRFPSWRLSSEFGFGYLCLVKVDLAMMWWSVLHYIFLGRRIHEYTSLVFYFLWEQPSCGHSWSSSPIFVLREIDPTPIQRIEHHSKPNSAFPPRRVVVDEMHVVSPANILAFVRIQPKVKN